MADTKITDLAALTGATLAAADVFVVVDVSDSTMSASGTDKKITRTELLTVFEAAGAAATAQAAAIAASQPVDSDLTAIAALATTAFGRSVLAAANAAALQTLAGTVIGTNVQAFDSELAAIAGLTSAANKGITFTGSGTAATYDLTAFALTLLDDANAAAVIATLGLGTAATTAATAYATAAQGTTADAALPKLAGGAAVENIGSVEWNVNTVAATGAAEALDVSVYGTHDCTMDQNCTFTFTNPAPSGKESEFKLILRGAFTPTLPAAVKWSAGTPPTYTTPSEYIFSTVDAGTTWLASQVGRAFA